MAGQVEPPPDGVRVGLLGDRAILYDPETASILDAVLVNFPSPHSKR